MRTTLILHGLVHRSLGHTIESLRRNVIAPLEGLGPVEVFYHSWDVAEVRNPRAGEADAVLDSSVIGEMLPEAKGLIEPQDDYLRTLDWERLSRRNPMRHCTSGEEAAALTLRNYLLALESQQRVWRVFEEQRGSNTPGLVVATRADLRFLDELQVPEVLVAALCERRSEGEDPDGRFIRIDGHRPPLQAPHRPPPQAALWLPKFHAWGGVNDRFAIGNEEAIRIWSHRTAFAEAWLERAKDESAEWLLMKWLEKNRVRVGFMDFNFQRIRANGLVADRDRELKASRPPGRTTVLKQERFLVLARQDGVMTENLRRVLGPLGRVEVIVDRPMHDSCASAPGIPHHGTPGESERRYVHLTDEEAAGFGGLMSDSFPRITAWSRAFAYLAGTLQEDEAVWFVEDDVAGDADSFTELVRITTAESADLSALDIRMRHEDTHWPWWNLADGLFANPCRAFQPLCRLSHRLVRMVMDFQAKHRRLAFHEVLFASLVLDHGMTWLDWRRNGQSKGLVADFRYRPDVEQARRGVCHPVKDSGLHTAVCALPPFATSRRRIRAGCQGWSILPDDYDFLVHWCRNQAFKQVVEFGPGDSTLALLDAGCRVVSHEHDISWLCRMLERFRDEEHVEILHCPDGCLPDPPGARPDLVLVDGPPFREGQKMSRLAQCEWALEHAGCFLLHDSKRSGERATLEVMEKRGNRVARIDTEKGLALVVDPALRPELLPTSARSIEQSARLSESWILQNIQSWRLRIGRTARPAMMLSTVPGTIGEAMWLLQHLFPHPASAIHVPSPASPGTEPPDAGDLPRGNVHWYDGELREILAWMIAGEGYWESFDFIHLTGTHDAPGLLGDACQAWSLLKPGAVMMIEADPATSAGLEAFRSVHEQHWITIHGESTRLLVRKCESPGVGLLGTNCTPGTGIINRFET